MLQAYIIRASSRGNSWSLKICFKCSINKTTQKHKNKTHKVRSVNQKPVFSQTQKLKKSKTQNLKISAAWRSLARCCLAHTCRLRVCVDVRWEFSQMRALNSQVFRLPLLTKLRFLLPPHQFVCCFCQATYFALGDLLFLTPFFSLKFYAR